MTGLKTCQKVLFRSVVVVLLGWLQLLAAPAVPADPALVLGVHPYLPRAELEKRFSPLATYLATQLDKPVRLRVSRNYETHIEDVGNRSLDIAYMGPASYVELTAKYGAHPTLARLEIEGNPYFNGYIVIRKDSALQSLAQLNGNRMAFGSARSTMGYLIPRYMLREAGVELESLSEYRFLGNHRNVALGVLLGDFDAGAVKAEVYQQFRDKGLRALAISPPVSEHLFVGRGNLPVSLQEAVRQALLGLARHPDGRKILTGIKRGASGLAGVTDADYDNLRVMMR